MIWHEEVRILYGETRPAMLDMSVNLDSIQVMTMMRMIQDDGQMGETKVAIRSKMTLMNMTGVGRWTLCAIEYAAQ